MAIAAAKATPGGGLAPHTNVGGAPTRAFAGTLTFTGDYSTGGEELDLSDYFPKGMQAIFIEPAARLIFQYDHDEEKVMVLLAGTADLAFNEYGDNVAYPDPLVTRFYAVGW